MNSGQGDMGLIGLAALFSASWTGEHASSEGKPFYDRIALDGQSVDDARSRPVAYSGVYSLAGSKPVSWMHLSFPSRANAQSHDQLMTALLSHGAPDCYGPKGTRPQHDADQLMDQLYPILVEASSRAARLCLPALAVVQSLTGSGAERVEFVAPRQVDGKALLSFMQLGHGTIWN